MRAGKRGRSRNGQYLSDVWRKDQLWLKAYSTLPPVRSADRWIKARLRPEYIVISLAFLQQKVLSGHFTGAFEFT